MKHTKTVTHEVEVIDWVECDLCCGEVQRDRYEQDADNLGDIPFDVVEPLVRTTGKVSKFPECGGDGITQTVNICGECWKNKLLPWLRAEGAAIDESEWYF